MFNELIKDVLELNVICEEVGERICKYDKEKFEAFMIILIDMYSESNEVDRTELTYDIKKEVEELRDADD